MRNNRTRSLKFRLNLICVALCAAAWSPAYAGGGFSQSTYVGSSGAASYDPEGQDTDASASGSVEIHGNGVDHASTVEAGASTFGGAGVGAGVTVRHETRTETRTGADATGTVTQVSTSKATTFSKDGNVIGKARNDTHTTVVIDGHTYVVADEVAKAVSRNSTAGSSSAAATEQTVTTDGNGYSVDIVNTHTAGRGSGR